MKQVIGSVALIVNEYDEAISFYCDQLGFSLREDTDLGGGKRWVLVSPYGAETSILLAKASAPDQKEKVGKQAGGRVGFFLHTDDFWRDYNAMKNNDIEFLEEPRVEAYGTVVVFADLYGNKWDLLQLNGR